MPCIHPIKSKWGVPKVSRTASVNIHAIILSHCLDIWESREIGRYSLGLVLGNGLMRVIFQEAGIKPNLIEFRQYVALRLLRVLCPRRTGEVLVLLRPFQAKNSWSAWRLLALLFGVMRLSLSLLWERVRGLELQSSQETRLEFDAWEENRAASHEESFRYGRSCEAVRFGWTHLRNKKIHIAVWICRSHSSRNVGCIVFWIRDNIWEFFGTQKLSRHPAAPLDLKKVFLSGCTNP
jgi:hypothetical protein